MEKYRRWRGTSLSPDFPGYRFYYATQKAVQVATYSVLACAAVMGVIETALLRNFSFLNLYGFLAVSIALGFFIRYPIRVYGDRPVRKLPWEEDWVVSLGNRRPLDNYDRPRVKKAFDQSLWERGKTVVYRKNIWDLLQRNNHLEELLDRSNIIIKPHILERIWATRHGRKPLTYQRS